MRRRNLLLHRLHEPHERGVALEIPRDQPLRVEDDGNRHEADGNDADHKGLQRKRSRTQLHLKVCIMS